LAPFFVIGVDNIKANQGDRQHAIDDSCEPFQTREAKKLMKKSMVGEHLALAEKAYLAFASFNAFRKPLSLTGFRKG
jgi:hypothetical protein